MRIGCLGPSGSFTEQGATVYHKDGERVMFQTIEDVLFAVDKGEVEEGVVPIENSTEGPVNSTIDTLIFDTNLYIKHLVVLPVSQNLLVRKNSIGKELTQILSHPQGLAQCKVYLNKNFNGIGVIPVDSTSKAAKMVSESVEDIGAIGTQFCAEIYDLDILHANIQDQEQNCTSFIVVSRKDTSLPAKGYKTSIAFSTLNKPGELYKILDIFSLWDLNMTKIVSRPMKKKIGEYVFYIDIEVENERDAADAFTMVKRKTHFFKVLGSYPVLDCTGFKKML